MPLTIVADPPSPLALSGLRRASNAGHVSVAGTNLHFNECEIKLLDGGRFRISFSYFLRPAVRGVQRYFLEFHL